jgi:aminodeoxychorismate synthase component I
MQFHSLSLPWQDPLELAQQFAREDTVILLYAGQGAPDGSRRSLLAIHPYHIITSSLADCATHDSDLPNSIWNSVWFGYCGYEQGLPFTVEPAPSFVPFPPVWFAQCEVVYVFDHHTQRLVQHSNANITKPLPQTEALSPPYSPPPLRAFSSQMTKAEYLAKVAATREHILNGEFYQANITRKFYGEWEQSPCPFTLFRALVKQSPAAFSALVKIGSRAILSSSPESFLSIAENGTMQARPIKGTIRRSTDPTQDAILREELLQSAKNRAENLMIVDLLRHDLAQSSQVGSVVVEQLCTLLTLPHLYHLVSTIRSQKREDISTLQAICHAFPPGSMTGAPKYRAMQWCREVEGMDRGVYSGALGWISPVGSAELSVVIRTLLLDGNRFEFQVGGGIVADSTPESEWEETLTKAAAIAARLGISDKQLRQ